MDEPPDGLPLSVMITSDEQEETVQQGLEMVNRYYQLVLHR